MRPSECVILYVEDEIIIALDTAQTLEDMGFAEVRLAHNLRRARVLAEQDVPDCALLDVNIAGEGLSLELGAALMAQGVPVVFASGYNRHEMEAEHAGLTFVEKPLSAAAIADAFERYAARAAGETGDPGGAAGDETGHGTGDRTGGGTGGGTGGD
jgi:DNA-binding NtrC family response regulator